MPHITLEHSANVAAHLNVTALFADLHRAIGQFEGFQVGDLKSRAVSVERTFFGDGKVPASFAHLDFRLLSGRDVSVRQRLVEVCLKLLAEHLDSKAGSTGCQLSVELREMDRSSYGKATIAPS